MCVLCFEATLVTCRKHQVCKHRCSCGRKRGPDGGNWQWPHPQDTPKYIFNKNAPNVFIFFCTEPPGGLQWPFMGQECPPWGVPPRQIYRYAYVCKSGTVRMELD